MGRQKYASYSKPDRRIADGERKYTGDQDFEGTFPGSEITGDELEFIKACERYMRENRRPFPKFTEILAVAKSLGYRKMPCLVPTGEEPPQPTERVNDAIG